MTRNRGGLVHLANTLTVDADLDDDDIARIEQAASRERDRIAGEKAWRERARVVETPHRPIVTVADDGAEEVDASGMVCDDCGRGLVSDAGSERILVCPRIHGRRPRELRPKDPDGAVCCGGPA